MRGNKKSQEARRYPPSYALSRCSYLHAVARAEHIKPEWGAKAPDSQQVFRYPTEVEPDFGTLDPALVQNADDSYAITDDLYGARGIR